MGFLICFFILTISLGMAKRNAAIPAIIRKVMGPIAKYFPPPEKLQSTKNNHNNAKEIISHLFNNVSCLKATSFSLVKFTNVLTLVIVSLLKIAPTL